MERINKEVCMHLKNIVSGLMFLHLAFVVSLLFVIFGVFESDLLLMAITNGKVEIISYLLLALLMFLGSLRLSASWPVKAKYSILLLIGSITLMLIMTYPYIDANMITCSLLIMLYVKDKSDTKNYLEGESFESDVDRKYPITLLIAMFTCVIIIALSLFNLVVYYMVGEVAFTVNMNVLLILTQSVYLMFTLKKLHLMKVTVPKWSLLFSLLFLPLVIIDFKRTVTLDGVYIASLMMMLTAFAITYHINHAYKSMSLFLNRSKDNNGSWNSRLFLLLAGIGLAAICAVKVFN